MSVTLPEAENFVLARWVTEWGTTTPFVFQEERQPSTISRGETDWALVQITEVDSDQDTLAPVGNRSFLRRAAAQITIYTPGGKGTNRALVLAQQAREVFEGISLNGLRFFAGTIERLGPVPPEYLVLVTCPFDYEERK